MVRDARERGQTLNVHGWIDALKDGLIRDLRLNLDGGAEVLPAYEAAIPQPPTLLR